MAGQHYPLTSQAASVQNQMMQPQGFGPHHSPGAMGAGGLQHQQSLPAPSQGPPPMMSPTKSVNTVSLCKLGQETNQELVQKLLEMFKHFKQMQLPNGTNAQMYQDKRMKIEESLRQLSMVFKKLKVIYNKVNELILEPEESTEEALIPCVGESVEERNTNTDAYRYVSEEQKQLIEQIRQKNQQVKEIIDKIRTVMWEINTMIVMRKT